MRKSAWVVASAALLVGCGGSGSAPVEAAADVDSAADTGADIAAPESDAAIAQAPDAAADSAVARQDKDADSAAVMDAADASLPEYFPGSPTPSTPGCSVSSGDAGDTTCCATLYTLGTCLCSSATLVDACHVMNPDAGLSEGATCYAIQKAYASGECD